MYKHLALLSMVSAAADDDKFDTLPNGDDTITMDTNSYSGYLQATGTK